MSTEDAPIDQPLRGIKVIDLTRLLPGPLATMQLAAMGAEVVKVEDRQEGDPARFMGQVRNAVSQFFVAVNHDKRFLRLDLKNKVDRETFLAMIESTDVLVDSFRPGVMDKLDLSWAFLKQRNPKLIMCSMTGYGQDGPLAHMAGHDINYIGYAGMLEQSARSDGVPTLSNLPVADLLGGTQAAVQAILAAIIGVKLDGRGRYLDISMTDNVFAHNILPMVAVNNFGETTAPGYDLLTGGVPCYNVYQTRDGRFMAVGALEIKFWELLCETLERPDLKPKHWGYGQEPGGVEAQTIKAELDGIFAQRTMAEWTAMFADVDCCVTPILRTDEALSHPLFVQRKMARQETHPTEGLYWRIASGIKMCE